MEELAMLTEKMSLEKKQRRRKKQDAEMDDGANPKIQIKSKAISKTRKERNRYKKSRKQLLH